MEVKKIVEGMTAPQVAQVIDENFNALNGEKATVEAVEAVQKNVNRSDDNTGVMYYPEYSSTEPVAVGDVRRYEGLLYRAKEAGAYDWDPEKWERVTLKQLEDEKLSELGSEVGKIKKGLICLLEKAKYNDVVSLQDAVIGDKIRLVKSDKSSNLVFRDINGDSIYITDHKRTDAIFTIPENYSYATVGFGDGSDWEIYLLKDNIEVLTSEVGQLKTGCEIFSGYNIISGVTIFEDLNARPYDTLDFNVEGNHALYFCDKDDNVLFSKVSSSSNNFTITLHGNYHHVKTAYGYTIPYIRVVNRSMSVANVSNLNSKVETLINTRTWKDGELIYDKSFSAYNEVLFTNKDVGEGERISVESDGEYNNITLIGDTNVICKSSNAGIVEFVTPIGFTEAVVRYGDISSHIIIRKISETNKSIYKQSTAIKDDVRNIKESIKKSSFETMLLNQSELIFYSSYVDYDRARVDLHINKAGIIHIIVPNNDKDKIMCNVSLLSENETSSYSSGWIKGDFIVDTDDYQFDKIRVIFGNNVNGTVLTAEEVINSKIQIVFNCDNNLLPIYWREYLEDKMPIINRTSADVALHGDSFVFFTDYHIEANQGKSHILIDRILKETSVNKVVFGGDMYNGSTTHDIALDKINLWLKRFSSILHYGVRGNHEYNWNDGGSVEEQVDDAEIYNFLCKKNETKVHTETGQLYGYEDNDNQKIRYIYLDSRYEIDPFIDDNQLDWMANRMAELSNEWTIVVFTHIMLSKGGEYTGSGIKIANKIKEVIPSMPATLACVICGHNHADVSKNDDFLAISTTNDTIYNTTDHPVQTKGTITEQAFDIFSIDTKHRTIKTVRIGYGEDREWSY